MSQCNPQNYRLYSCCLLRLDCASVIAKIPLASSCEAPTLAWGQRSGSFLWEVVTCRWDRVSAVVSHAGILPKEIQLSRPMNVHETRQTQCHEMPWILVIFIRKYDIFALETSVIIQLSNCCFWILVEESCAIYIIDNDVFISSHTWPGCPG